MHCSNMNGFCGGVKIRTHIILLHILSEYHKKIRIDFVVVTNLFSNNRFAVQIITLYPSLMQI